MGFKSATVSGAGVSESRMCVPDMGIMGLADSVDQFRNIARCVDIPLKADADTGYGNAVNVYFAIQAYEQAGAACIMLEDQVWPERWKSSGNRTEPERRATDRICASTSRNIPPSWGSRESRSWKTVSSRKRS